MKLKKKSFILSSLLVLTSSLFAVDLELFAKPSYSIPLGAKFSNLPGVDGGLGVNIKAIPVRTADRIFFSAGDGLKFLSGPGIDTMNVMDLTFGAGYDFRVIDRLSLGVTGETGFWAINPDSSTKFEASSGLIFSGNLYADFHASPSLSIGAYAGYKDYFYRPESFMKCVEVGLNVKYNITQGLFGNPKVSVTEYETEPLFPVFYSRYSENGFGTVTFVNEEENDIKDVQVQIFIEQFMNNPSSVITYPAVKKGESVTVDLKAFLNESILNNLAKSTTEAKIIINYKSLGKKVSKEESINLVTLKRNNMTWDDDRKAAAFVSSGDAAASLFAKQVKSIVKDSMRSDISANIQYAAALYGALKAYGIHYKPDETSPFTANVGNATIDSLNFPFLTLQNSAGDCDDLSILNCALLQALGVDTAFITVPGHIYIAFDSGYTLEEAKKKIAGNRFVEKNGKIWIPLEITLCQDPFQLELMTGYREWQKYDKQGSAVLIPLSEAWEVYQSVGITDSDIKIEMPSKAEILTEFKNALK